MIVQMEPLALSTWRVRAEIPRAFLGGLSLEAVARKYGWTMARVEDVLRETLLRLGAPPVDKGGTEEP